jgi:mRNA interferase RelE/StbE
MAAYKIVHKPSLDKDFRLIPDKDLKKIVKRIQSLALSPRPLGNEKLTGKGSYRLRQGDYRIMYTIDDVNLVVRIIKVGHRRDVYLAREERSKYLAEKKSPRNKTGNSARLP